MFYAVVIIIANCLRDQFQNRTTTNTFLVLHKEKITPYTSVHCRHARSLHFSGHPLSPNEAVHSSTPSLMLPQILSLDPPAQKVNNIPNHQPLLSVSPCLLALMETWLSSEATAPWQTFEEVVFSLSPTLLYPEVTKVSFLLPLLLPKAFFPFKTPASLKHMPTDRYSSLLQSSSTVHQLYQRLKYLAYVYLSPFIISFM